MKFRAGEFAWRDEKFGSLLLYKKRYFKLNKTATIFLELYLKGFKHDKIIDAANEKLNIDTKVSEKLWLLFEKQLEAIKKSKTNYYIPEEIVQKEIITEELKGPYRISLEITPYCNSKCIFCYASNMKENRKMSFGQYIDVIKKIAAADIFYICFTGGEPTLDEHLLDYMELATKLGLKVDIISNGTLITREMAKKFADLNLNYIQISVEGPTAQIHDKITRNPGSFEKAVNGIHILQEFGIDVSTNTTLNSMNCDEIINTLKFLKDIGVKHSNVNRLITTGNAALDPNVTLSKEKLFSTIKKIAQFRESNQQSIQWLGPIPICSLDIKQLGFKSRPSCTACNNSMVISTDGSIRPCVFLPMILGNIFKDGIENVWSSGIAKKFRKNKILPQECINCPKSGVCRGGCKVHSYTFHKDLYHLDPLASPK